MNETHTKPADSQWAFELKGVSKQYPHFQLSGVNLKLGQGQVMGLIGPNGAGKSTTLKILMGQIQAEHGSVQVLGHQLPEQQVDAKWQVGFASEDMRLYGQVSIEWHMQYLASLYQQWDPDYARTLLKRFDLNPAQTVKGLSHGQRVKAMLLLVLARRPKLLLLDEPTTGLDPVARHEVLNEFMDVMLDDDRSILFSSHNTQDVEQLSDHITFIDKGRVIQSKDKESYLDDWRRLRLNLPEGAALPALQGVVELRRSGQQAIITTQNYAAEMIEVYQRCGAEVTAVETMNLEEIFVSEVQHARQNNHNETGAAA